MKTKKNNKLSDSPVKNIPGPENLMAHSSGDLADSTIFSGDDEEANDLLDDQGEIVAEQLNANVTKDERKLLDDAAKKVDSSDQAALEKAKLDQYDEDGEPLNEKTGLSGNDLDVPGSELDDDNEKIGEEDEENNSYSLNDEHEDDNNTRQ